MVMEQILAKAITARVCACCSVVCPDGLIIRFKGERACSWRCLAHLVTERLHR